jgi:cellobiose-specific phosphotransferase system component IIB
MNKPPDPAPQINLIGSHPQTIHINKQQTQTQGQSSVLAANVPRVSYEMLKNSKVRTQNSELITGYGIRY